ncbi:MAG TPA: Ig-like domain-containing protein [Acetobacteraceae bacterium]|nr:Ig-like domain-containing protein [Acetobacteraceae bacterium]
MPTLVEKPLIAVDGNLSDWTSADLISNPANAVPGYQLYGTVQDNAYIIGISATEITDSVVGANTTIWLNTDQNTATGYNLGWANIGADYEIQFDGSNTPYLYSYDTTTQLWTQVSSTPLTFAMSTDGESLEIAIPRSLLTPTGSTAPANINIAAQITTPATPTTAPTTTYLPSYYAAQPEYTITDPATLPTPTETHKVAIVYSDTSANLYFSKSAYDDLFMAAQNQARMAGISYDVIDESQLTNIKNLVGYDALIFPAMADVNTTQLPAIMSTLNSAVVNYHIGIITAGDFLTNDQTGAPLPGNSYVNMEALLGLARASGGNSGDVTVTAGDVSNPIMQSYTAGQVIQTYSSEGYAAYTGVNTPTAVLANQNVAGVGTLPGVIQTTTGGTNVHFATADMLGDSNLLSNAIQNVVLGTQPGVTLHTSRDAGIVAARMDMDQSQFPSDVSPTGGGQGIYDKLIPILQQWNQQYDFVGSFFVNIGDNASNAGDPTGTDWAKSLAYYKTLLAMGSEIGNHSYTHLINPPMETFTATTVGDTPAGSTQITLGSVPSFAGVTVGMTVSGLNIGANTPLPGAAGEGGAVANTTVTAVSGNTITLSYIPGGYGTGNDGVLGDIPAGTTLTFGIPAENSNFLQTGTGTVTGSAGYPFTYDYEFNQSKTILQAQLGTTIYGAAIPGANEIYATDQNILAYYQSVAPTASTPGYTGYLTGGWTGVGSGYPSAFGYMSPTDQGAVYLAPNMTFDFTEIQYQGKTIAQAEADWAAQFNALAAHAAGTPVIVWPIHDYGVAAWDTSGTGAASPYTTQLYADFIAMAAADNYEFVTLEDLASRIMAQEKATINYTTSGNAITVTVTPDASAADLGAMALGVINGGTEVIENVTNWYAYNAQELFLPRNGGTFTINLGATQDDVTHIDSLPMRSDLLSVSGDGLDLSFSLVGDGLVGIDLGPIGTITPIVTGATVVSLSGGQLELSLSGLTRHDVSIWVLPSVSALRLSADSGASATDFITNVASQTITGTLNATLPIGDVVQVSLNGGTTWLTATAAPGSSSFTLAGVRLTGSNALKARVATSTGVTGPVFSQTYVLDQTPPAAPSTPSLAVASDSGVSNRDNITNITTPIFTGKAEAGSQVKLYDGSTLIGTTTAASNGTWGLASSKLSDGVHTVTATATDVAGNVGGASAKLWVTVDTVAPSAPVFTALNASSLLTTINGTSEAGSIVSVFNGTTSLGTTTASSNGTWSWLFLGTSNSVRVLTATASDKAGNKSGTNGTEQIGTGQADQFSATAGTDLFYGGASADRFTFAALSGHDIIQDFAVSGSSHDVINFHGISTLNSFTSVMSHATQVGSGTVIALDGNNNLTLANVLRSTLTTSDFTFV